MSFGLRAQKQNMRFESLVRPRAERRQPTRTIETIQEDSHAHYDAKQGSFDCNRSVAVWCGFFTSITIHGFSRNEESGVEHFPGFLH